MLLEIDVRRAHFYAKATRRINVELPEEDGGGPGSWQCGLLRQNLNGTHDATHNWERAWRLQGGDWRAQGARTHTPERHGESALRFTETTSLSRPPRKTLSG